MRREQIHKICLNHALTDEVEYKLKDAKSWQFIANDFSEGEVELDNFSLRFKTDEIAKDFKRAVDDALAGKGPKLNGDCDQADASSNVATTEESKNITNLKLPGNFYDYKTRTECTGCRGCLSEDYEFSEVKDTNFGQIDDNPLPLVAPPKVDMTANDLSKDTKKSGQPFPLTSHGNEGNGFKFGTPSNTNNVQSTGMFFGSSNFKSAFGTDSKKADDTNANNSFGLFGANVTKTPSSEPVKSSPSFSFNSSNVFGSNGMCELLFCLLFECKHFIYFSSCYELFSHRF